MTATQTPCAGAPARQRDWEDTVFEAVGELRRRLASSREEVVTSALETIIAVEKTRMRHGRPVSGTQVSHVRDDDGSLPKLGPLEVDQPLPPKRREGEAPAEPRPSESPAHCEQIVPIAQVSEPTTPTVAPLPDEPQRSLTLPSRAEPPMRHGPTRESQATSAVGTARAPTPPPNSS